MTREEQIYCEIDKSKHHVDSPFDYETGFKYGVAWADKHPKEGLVSVEKACEWLEEKLLCAEGCYPTIEFLPIIEYDSLKEFINDFRKSMEE